ncbi:hypothetical protein C8R47DRAFT_420417 [Mycena vitilis]|nr:hypothetical protein C8R47DRAFT_420417 [Mycena vitilis]
MIDSLAADRARLTEIDAEILDLKRSLSQSPLEETISGDLARIGPPMDSGATRFVQVSGSTLPTEIVSEIFIHSLPPYPICSPLWGLLSPTNLTHICREWRDIALVTPELWRAMRLSISTSSHGNGADIKRRRDMLDLWLKRSCSYPLSIQLPRFHNSDLLVPQRARLKCVKITALVMPDLKLIKGPLPLLRHLDLSLASHSWWGVFDCTQAPRLRTVILDGLAASKITLPWLQITCLTLHRVAVRGCASILQRIPNLVHCALNFWAFTDYDNDYDNVVDITLPYLESLHFHPHSDTEPEFFSALVTPSLRTLKLQTFISMDASTYVHTNLTDNRPERGTGKIVVTRESRESLQLARPVSRPTW